MLSATPKSIFSWDYIVSDGGTPIAELDVSWFRERGSFTMAGHQFDVLRTSMLGGTFELHAGDLVLASARKPSAFLRSLEVQVEGRCYTLSADQPFTRCFSLHEGNRQLGTIRPLHWMTRKARIDLPDDINPAVQLFMFWLVAVLWRRAASNNSGS